MYRSSQLAWTAFFLVKASQLAPSLLCFCFFKVYEERLLLTSLSDVCASAISKTASRNNTRQLPQTFIMREVSVVFTVQGNVYKTNIMWFLSLVSCWIRSALCKALTAFWSYFSSSFFPPRALFTYEGNTNDIRLADKGGECSRYRHVLMIIYGYILYTVTFYTRGI